MRGKLAGQQFLNLAVFLAIAYASYFLILLSLPYIDPDPRIEFLHEKQLIYHIKYWRYSFYVHVFTSPLVIVGGLLQFSRWIIRNWPKVHKISGYIYVIVILFITGPAAFFMSLWANGSYPAQISFVFLTCLWILFTFLAYRRIKKRDPEGHVKWMIRSYALTLSAVTLRLYNYLLTKAELDIGGREMYILLSYISWIPNLFFAQILIWLKYPKYLLNYKKTN